MLCLALMISVFGTFGRGIKFPFLAYDDGIHIYANPYLSPVRAEGIGHFWGVPFRPKPKLVQGRELPPYEQLYGPVAFTVWSLLSPIAPLNPPQKTPLDTLSPINPAVYHFASILVHGLNAVLLFLLLRRLFRSDAVFLAALLWALHPIQVESVEWVTQLNTLLCALFSLAAVHLYLSFDRMAREGLGSRWAMYLAATLCFAFGLLSKPLATITVIVIAAVVYLDRLWNGRDFRFKVADYLAPLPWAGLCLVVIKLNAGLQQPGVAGPQIPWKQRFFQVGDSFAFYGGKVLWPFNFCPDYGRRPAVILDYAWGYWTWLFPALAVLAALVLWRAYPVLLISAAIFIGTLLPTSGIIPYYYHFYSTVADRYAYFALVGPALLVAWLVAGAPGRPAEAEVSNQSPRRFIRGGCVVVAVILAFLSVKQVGVWQDDLHVWSQGVKVSSTSFLSLNNLAVAYMKRGNDEMAISYFERTLAMKPGKAEAQYNLAVLLDKNGPTEEGMSHMEAALDLTPYNPETQNQYAVALATRGKFREAILHWQLATKLDPKYSDAWVNLGVALAQDHRENEAIEAWKRAAVLKPDSAELHFNLGIALERQGDLAAARREWQLSLGANPSYNPAVMALRRTARN